MTGCGPGIGREVRARTSSDFSALHFRSVGVLGRRGRTVCSMACPRRRGQPWVREKRVYTVSHLPGVEDEGIG